MGINISDIEESELLSVLGKSDWHIALPDDLPDLVITVAWRQALIEDAGREFVRWVRRGQDVRIDHANDPVWDSSGTARTFQTDSFILLTRHVSLKTWLTEYTGNSRATYLAGMGLAWLTYEDEVGHNIWNVTGDLLRKHVQKIWNYADDIDVWEDARWNDIEIIEMQVCWALGQVVGQLSTAEAWERYQPDVVFEEEEQLLRVEADMLQRQEVEEMAAGFWQQHFSDLQGHRIELSQFAELGLVGILEDLFADTDPDVVEAIAEVGLPGDLSSKAQQMVRGLARQALT